MMKKIGLFALSVLFLTSCMKDKYDMENVQNKMTPMVATPLLNSTFEFTSFLGGIDTMEMAEKDADGLIHFILRDTLFTYEAGGLLNAPSTTVNQSFDIEPITLESIQTTTAVTLNEVVSNMSDSLKTIFQTADGNNGIFPEMNDQSSDPISVPASDQFDEVTLSSGVLRIAIENGWPADLTDVQIELKNSTSGTVLDTFTYALIPAGQTETERSDLAGETLESGLAATIISMSSPGSDPDSVYIDLSDSLELVIDFDSLVIVSGTAIFETQKLMDDSIAMGMDLGNGEVIETITLKDGSFDYNFASQVQENSQVQITIESLAKDGLPFDLTIDIPAATSTDSSKVNGSVDLTGYVITPSRDIDTFTNGLQIDISASIISSGNKIDFDTSQGVSADIDLQGLEIARFDGDLGNRSISLASDTTSMDMNTSINGLEFTNPTISLVFNSSMGVPLGLDLSGLSMVGSDDNVIALSGAVTETTQTINAPSAAGSFERTTISLTKDNSNIPALVSATPKEMITAVSASLNPGGTTTNFILDTSKIELFMDMDIPLEVKMEEFHAYDTIDIDPGMVENLKYVELLGEVVNGLPVDLDFEIYFLDNNYKQLGAMIDSDDKFAPAGTVNSAGEVTASTTTEVSVLLTESKIDIFNQAEYLLVDVVINTPKEGGEYQSAKFISTSEFKMKLGLKAKAMLNFLNGGDDE